MRKLFYSIILLVVLLNLEGCKKESVIEPITPTIKGTVLDSIIGFYSGTHQYVNSDGIGDLINYANLNIIKSEQDRYKVIVSNIFNPYTFELNEGRKIGDVIVFNISRQIYLDGPFILYGDYSYIQVNESVSLFYELNTKELQYGIELSNNGNYAGFHRGYYIKK